MIIFAVIQGLYILRQDEGEINACIAIFKNIRKQLKHTMIRHSAKIPPSSSETAEKIKSCFTTGILTGRP